MGKTSVNLDAVKLDVYTSRFNRGFSYSWEARSDILVGNISLTSGMSPSSCIMLMSYNRNDSGHLHAVDIGESSSMLLTNGQDGNTLTPHGIMPFEFVKVVTNGGEDSGKIVFLGMITGWRMLWTASAVGFELVAQDYRVLLERIKCVGSIFRRPVANDTVFVPNFGPHFGRDGQADMTRDAFGGASGAFTTQNYNRNADGQVDGGAEYSDYWTCGDALNSLRYHYGAGTSVSSRLVDTRTWLSWPQAGNESSVTQWAFLFGDRQVSDLDCCGQSLAWSIDRIVSTAGMVDWTLEYTTSGGQEIAELVVYEVINDQYDDGTPLTYETTEGGGNPVQPDVMAINLEHDWSEAYAGVRAVGAKRVVDTTIEYDSEGAESDYLRKGWSSAEETAWLDSREAEEAIAGSRAYETVFRHYVASDEYDWSTVFADDNFDDYSDDDTYIEGPRKIFSELASVGLAEDGYARQIKMPMRIWRTTDGGSTYDEIPDGGSAQPLVDRTGIALSPNLRKEGWNWSQTGAGEARTITNYGIRATVSIETDQRVEKFSYDDIESEWPDGELYIDAGPAYRYESRSYAYIPTSDGTTSGDIKMNATTSALFAETEGTHDVVRDDSDNLGDLADRRLTQVCRPRARGTITLGGIRADITPGFRVGSLNGSIPIVIGMAVRSVEFNHGQSNTVLRFEAI